MKKLEIVEINNYHYKLKNENNYYDLELEFYDIDILPKIGTIVYISDNLLDKNYEEYSNSYCFGMPNSTYGRELKKAVDNDIIMLDIDGNKIYLQRYYG